MWVVVFLIIISYKMLRSNKEYDSDFAHSALREVENREEGVSVNLVARWGGHGRGAF